MITLRQLLDVIEENANFVVFRNMVYIYDNKHGTRSEKEELEMYLEDEVESIGSRVDGNDYIAIYLV